MATSTHTSPNAIPPRRSSTGYTFHPITPENPRKPILKPLTESSWMSSTSSTASPPHPNESQPHHTRSRTKSSSYIDPALKSAYSPAFHTRTTPPTSTPLTNPSFSSAVETIIHDPSCLWSSTKEKILLGPYDYMYDHPGKDIRKQLIHAFNGWLQVPPPSLHIIQKVVGMLHTASLLVDDVEDSSLLRRGVPVAHSIFGTAQTINSANYVYFGALRELLKLGNDKVIQIYTEELCNLHRGQGMDLFWRDTLTCPTEMDYLEMVGNKTGGLFRLAVLLMQAESTTSSNRDFTPLVSTIGLLFQIRDDYLNLSSPLYTSTKGLCEDLTEGKFSFPIIHAIRSNPSNLQLMNILKQKTTDEDVKRYAVKYMEKCGSFEYCRKVMGELHEKAVGIIEGIEREDGKQGGSEGVKLILEKMAVREVEVVGVT